VKLPPAHLGVAIMIGVGFALLPLSTDLFLAALPGMRAYFGVTVSHAQLTLSIFLAGFAVSQLVYGPLSDRLGRRPVLLGGVAIYAAATVVCAAAPSMEALIAARFFQAVGACSGAVIGRAIIRDAYGATGSARMLGYITAGTAAAPIFGPMIGSVLTVAFGWRANFVLLALVGTSLLAVAALRLPESNLERDPRATHPRHILANYAAILRNRRFVGYVLGVAFSYAAIFSYVSGSSFVLIDVLGVPARYFGFLFGGTVVCYIASNILIGRLVQRTGVDRLLNVGTTVAVLGGSLMAALAYAGVQSVAAVLLPMMMVLFAAGFTMPGSTAGAIGPFARKAGAASSLVGFVQMAFGALAGFLVGRFHDGSTWPMAASICAATWLLLASFRLLVRPERS
jgi:DHA1 family bicyclomycin/chloramphenicol resistance-like MFS transporter